VLFINVVRTLTESLKDTHLLYISLFFPSGVPEVEEGTWRIGASTSWTHTP